jgi:cellulose synthase/poly-beta-1,6-N-acetylglucosamine synthase-like glycosyltransferase
MTWYFNDFEDDIEGWPAISLVTPSYNQAEYLEHALRSVLEQEYPNLEYIVMDGGSDDGSPSIIERFGSDLAYWQSEPDQGMYDALNRGFARSTGEIMGWLNSDDLHFPWTLHVVGSIFHHLPSVDWITTLRRGWGDRTGVVGVNSMRGFAREAFRQGRYGGWKNPLLKYGYIQQESTFWRRSLWEASEGLSLTCGDAADFDLWCQFYKRSDLHGVNVPLGIFRQHADQKTADKSSYQTECKEILGHHFGSVRSSVQEWATSLRLDRSPLASVFEQYIGYEGTYIKREADQEGWVLKEKYFI